MPHVAARMASRDEDAGRYQRHRPELTLLYQIVEEYYPAFTAHLGKRLNPFALSLSKGILRKVKGFNRLSPNGGE